jgi:hypothetical protein
MNVMKGKKKSIHEKEKKENVVGLFANDVLKSF